MTMAGTNESSTSLLCVRIVSCDFCGNKHCLSSCPSGPCVCKLCIRRYVFAPQSGELDEKEARRLTFALKQRKKKERHKGDLKAARDALDRARKALYALEHQKQMFEFPYTPPASRLTVEISSNEMSDTVPSVSSCASETFSGPSGWEEIVSTYQLIVEGNLLSLPPRVKAFLLRLFLYSFAFTTCQ